MRTTQHAYRSHDISEHWVQSKVVPQAFKIQVLQPIRRADDSEKFPVIYVTDGDDLFGALATLANYLQVCGEAARFILVGIGYGNPRAAELLRMRDLYTHGIRRHFQAEIERVAASAFVDGANDLKAIIDSTDAGEFLRFIREELMPFVATHYPALPDDNHYSGYSAGGTFGLYTLLTQPGTFKRYILGSPATSYLGHHFGIELTREFIRSGQRMDSRVFMCVGELEELHGSLDQYDLVTGYYQLAKFLKKSSIPGLDLTVRVFPDETHATAWTLAFSHGVRTLFGSGSASFLPR